MSWAARKQDYRIGAGMNYRVTFGWSNYKDFADIEAARDFAFEMVAKPEPDTLSCVVSILDMNRRGPMGAFHRVGYGVRPVAQ